MQPLAEAGVAASAAESMRTMAKANFIIPSTDAGSVSVADETALAVLSTRSMMQER